MLSLAEMEHMAASRGVGAGPAVAPGATPVAPETAEVADAPAGPMEACGVCALTEMTAVAATRKAEFLVKCMLTVAREYKSRRPAPK